MFTSIGKDELQGKNLEEVTERISTVTGALINKQLVGGLVAIFYFPI